MTAAPLPLDATELTCQLPRLLQGKEGCGGVCLARAALCPVHTFLRTRAWAMTRTRRVLSQSPRKMAADGGLSYKETNKVNSQDNARETCLPTVTLHLREPHLVGSDDLERDPLFLPSS